MLIALVILGYVIGFIVLVAALGPASMGVDREEMEGEDWLMPTLLGLLWPLTLVAFIIYALLAGGVVLLNDFLAKVSRRS